VTHVKAQKDARLLFHLLCLFSFPIHNRALVLVLYILYSKILKQNPLMHIFVRVLCFFLGVFSLLSSSSSSEKIIKVHLEQMLAVIPKKDEEEKERAKGQEQDKREWKEEWNTWWWWWWWSTKCKACALIIMRSFSPSEC